MKGQNTTAIGGAEVRYGSSSQPARATGRFSLACRHPGGYAQGELGVRSTVIVCEFAFGREDSVELLAFIPVGLAFASVFGALFWLLSRTERNRGDLHGGNSILRHLHPPHGLG